MTDLRQAPDAARAIAERAPLPARAVVPVHADCHWGNWLACDAEPVVPVPVEPLRRIRVIG